MAAFVGKHNLSVVDEPGCKKHSLWRVIIHDDWDWNHQRFDADISLAVLTDDVTFNDYVRLVCLPSRNISAAHGIVLGWGRSEHSDALGQVMDSTLNELQVSIIDRYHCLIEIYKLAELASKRTFCAGFANRSTSVCNGDSGGGLYTIDDASGRYEVAGIVSSGLQDEFGQCDTEAYTIYTYVNNFKSWIEEKIAEGLGERDRGEKKTFKCGKDQLTPTQDVQCARLIRYDLIEEFTLFTNNPIADIGLQSNDLKMLKISETSLKFIERDDFENLKQLEILLLSNNQIEFLPENTFEHLENLEILFLDNNKIKNLEPNIFMNLRKMEKINLHGNRIEFLPKDLFKLEF